MMMSAQKGKPQQQRRHSSSNAQPQPPNANVPPRSMFHACQESTMLFNEFARRNIESFEQRRRAELQRIRENSGFRQHMTSSPQLQNWKQQQNLMNASSNVFPRQALPTKIHLTMEMQGSDFASLHDGREAWALNDSLAAIMDDTKCMILFADQSDPKAETKGLFNQVTVIGEMPNIDTAMGRIRDFAPITVAISLKHVKEQYRGQDLTSVIRNWCLGTELSSYTKVQFSILYPPSPFILPDNDDANFLSLVVRGSRKDAKLMSAACNTLTKLLFSEVPREDFWAALELPTSQRRMLVGSPDGVLISAIASKTKATIHFPTSNSTTNASTYLLCGAAASVINAIQLIHDICPVRIEFEAEHSQLVPPMTMNDEQHREVDLFDNERGVIVQLRKSAYEGSFRAPHEEMRHSLKLMTSEENIQNLYQIRKNLLVESFTTNEAPALRKMSEPRFLEYLKVLVMESSVRAYIGNGKLISVCRCRSSSTEGDGIGV